MLEKCHIDDVCALYRAFHRIPEYGDKLPLTRKLLCGELDKIGVPYTCFQGHDAVVAEVTGAFPGKTVAYRADMDALHITEQTGLPYTSTFAGCMHACGHDAHTAIALCALRKLVENSANWHGKVRFLFEAGEETGVGALHLLEENALQGVDALFGLHVGTLAGRDIPDGTFVVLPGAVTAAKDKFTVKIIGSGGHGAYPCEAVDPIRIAAQVITAIQSIVSMEVPSGNGAVITFGRIQGGVDNNSVPDCVQLDGTVRTQDETVRQLIRKRICEITEAIPKAFGGNGICTVQRGSEPVINDEGLASFAAEVLSEKYGKETVLRTLPKALMGSDDFARLAKLVPSVYFFLSTCDAAKHTDYPNHNPKFAVDEAVLPKAVDGVTEILTAYLRQP